MLANLKTCFAPAANNTYLSTIATSSTLLLVPLSKRLMPNSFLNALIPDTSFLLKSTQAASMSTFIPPNQKYALWTNMPSLPLLGPLQRQPSVSSHWPPKSNSTLQRKLTSLLPQKDTILPNHT